MSTKVSVVIPTMLRSTLSAAVESVERQTVDRSNIEIIVVADVGPDSIIPEGIADRCDRIILTGGGKGGGGARATGVRAATHDLVAFLDDDDEWLPAKLEHQLHALGKGDPLTIVSCQVIQHGASLAERVVPVDVIAQGQNIQDYLFRRRSASIGRASMFTSTLLASRELLLRTEWNSSLRRHQDWDWLVRVGRVPGVQFVQLQKPLVRYWTGSANSISASANWRDSLNWYLSVAEDWHPQTAVDFLFAQTLRYSLQSRSFSGVRSVLSAALSLRRMPSWSCVIVGASGVFGRAQLQRAMHATGRAYVSNGERANP
ncbi:glycosyltransferase [Microbacterium sp.]|uniref:glycosyltransferase family 2 protein n=1 Tax=Microbacterium sp. TaxID=51671 RepID=UPI0034596ED1